MILLVGRPGLHIWMGFIEEEVSHYDSNEEQGGADEVGEKVGKLGEETTRREEVRIGLSRFCENTAN